MLVAEPCRAPLAYGPENMLWLSLAGHLRACRVMIRHVGTVARAWCSLSRVTAWRRRHAGSLARYLALVRLAGASVWLLWPEA